MNNRLSFRKKWERQNLEKSLSVSQLPLTYPNAKIVIICKTTKIMSTVLPFRINTNVNGIPSISSQSVSVNTAGDTVSFDFLNHPTTGGVFRGWITVRLAQAIPTGTATTAEVVFTTEGGNATQAYGYDNTPLTVANLRGTGVYIFWYEGQSRYLQLVSGNFI